MPRVQFICLANSWKMKGRCVAGWRLDGHGWIRPVSSRPDGTLFAEYLYGDGSEPALLDIVEVEVTAARPEVHQPENWVLGSARWRLVRRIGPASAARQLAAAIVPGPVLLDNRSDSVEHAVLLKQPATASLALVEPQSIQWYITTNPFDGRRKTRCYFSLGSCHYDLAITDPLFVLRLGSLREGYHPRDAAGLAPDERVVLTVSLGEPFEKTGHCYKLVAAVVVLPGPVPAATPRGKDAP